MNKRIYLVLPPNITRRAREIIMARFPEAELDSPDIHPDMFEFANTFGDEVIPALTVTAYPQVAWNLKRLQGSGLFAVPSPALPPLRPELAALSLTPPLPEQKIVALVPVIIAASSDLEQKPTDWADLCEANFPGPIGCPPNDTPLPYVAEPVMRSLVGSKVHNLLNKLDTRSNPIDINKRIASHELTAAFLIPAFARTFREGSGQLIWPESGAIALPLTAVLSADADPIAHEILAFLLSPEFQTMAAQDGIVVPVIENIPGFDELEENNWNLLWPGWEALLSIAATMREVSF